MDCSQVDQLEMHSSSYHCYSLEIFEQKVAAGSGHKAGSRSNLPPDSAAAAAEMKPSWTVKATKQSVMKENPVMSTSIAEQSSLTSTIIISLYFGHALHSRPAFSLYPFLPQQPNYRKPELRASPPISQLPIVEHAYSSCWMHETERRTVFKLYLVA